MQIGRAQLAAVVEVAAHPVPVAGMCYGWDMDKVGSEADWLFPRHVDPVGQMVNLSYHSWLLHTADFTALIDPCIGNNKSRPFSPEYDRLDTPWLERLSAAGAQPDSIDLVICTHLHL